MLLAGSRLIERTVPDTVVADPTDETVADWPTFTFGKDESGTSTVTSTAPGPTTVMLFDPLADPGVYPIAATVPVIGAVSVAAARLALAVARSLSAVVTAALSEAIRSGDVEPLELPLPPSPLRLPLLPEPPDAEPFEPEPLDPEPFEPELARILAWVVRAVERAAWAVVSAVCAVAAAACAVLVAWTAFTQSVTCAVVAVPASTGAQAVSCASWAVVTAASAVWAACWAAVTAAAAFLTAAAACAGVLGGPVVITSAVLMAKTSDDVVVKLS